MGNSIPKFLVLVPQQQAYIVEQFGRYHSTLTPGLQFLIPYVQQVVYQHSLKEQTYMISAQNAVTKDNVIIQLDGVLYMQIADPVKCSYGSQDPLQYAQILAQSVMRSEIGKVTLDQTFEERDALNVLILSGLSNAIEEWGMKCLRYEIKDIKVSENIRKVMNLEAEAERQKRADILKSEGQQQSEVNLAEAIKRSKILKAQGNAQGNVLAASAIVQKIELISKAMTSESGELAARFNIAEQYIEAIQELNGKQILVHADINDPKDLVRQAIDMVDLRGKST